MAEHRRRPSPPRASSPPRRRFWLASAAVTLASGLAAFLLVAPAATAEPPAGLTVTIHAPDGVAANVVLTSINPTTVPPRRVVTKPAAGTSTTVALSLTTGAYRVSLPLITVDGVAYAGVASRPQVVPTPGIPTPLDVTFTADGGSRDLGATSIGRTSIGLAWKAPAGAQVALRRTAGATPVLTRTAGVAVPTSGAAATDSGLQAGTQYAYSLFTQVKGQWVGPLTVVAGTAPDAGSDKAAYVAPPTTLIARLGDVVSADPTGTGVRAVFGAAVTPPVLGAGVTLPVSDALPGGFLGVVTGLSADGRTVDLTAGGLSDAFDYYDLDTQTFGAAPAAPTATGFSAKVAPAGGAQPAAVQSAAGAPVERGETPPGSASPASAAGAQAAPQPLAAKAAAIGVTCKGAGNETVTFKPDVQFAGHLGTKLDKKRFLGVDVPTGASVNMELTATVTGAAKVKVSGSYECSLDLPKYTKILTLDPVPISLVASPQAALSVGGSTEIDNIGVTATGGFRVNGTMTLKNGPSFQGSVIANATPLTPKITKNATVNLQVGGDVVVGPGAGTSDAGAIAGVRGKLIPLDASFGPQYTEQDSRYNSCLVAKAQLTVGVSLTAKAWLNNWKYSTDITVAGLNGTHPYGGSPWALPTGCDKLPPAGSPDSLLGPGVTKVDDTVTGGADQWGHVDGFVPGQKTWVLSTGLISNAVGSPGFFASTDLGEPGDDDLSALAGHPTFDAASYQTTLVPTGSTLHVKYVFASEEYPEYVGSAFNDVMAVYVNGKNCAFVPGTTTPVAINTVNDHTNSAYYVDNATGAAGYGTTMDGLTTPLTCSVPVTPGQPVTVRIAVADTSDHVYDSAVALVDGGIWTD